MLNKKHLKDFAPLDRLKERSNHYAKHITGFHKDIKSKARNCYLSGFTLLEMLVVLIIIGILAAIAVPYFWGSYSSIELKGSARTVASVLRTAKSYTETQNVDYYVVFDASSDPDNLLITIYKDSVASGNEVGKTEKLPMSAIIQYTVTFASNTALFTPHGTSNGGTVTITNAKKGKSIDVTVLASTARVKVKDLN